MRAFDKEERDLMESVEKEEWISLDNLDREIKKAREAATYSFGFSFFWLLFVSVRVCLPCHSFSFSESGSVAEYCFCSFSDS